MHDGGRLRGHGVDQLPQAARTGGPSDAIVHEGLNGAQRHALDARVGAEQANLNRLVHQPHREVAQGGSQSIQTLGVHAERDVNRHRAGSVFGIRHVGITPPGTLRVNGNPIRDGMVELRSAVGALTRPSRAGPCHARRIADWRSKIVGCPKRVACPSRRRRHVTAEANRFARGRRTGYIRPPPQDGAGHPCASKPRPSEARPCHPNAAHSIALAARLGYLGIR